MRYYHTPALVPIVADASLKAFAAPKLKRPQYKRNGEVRLKWKPNRDDRKNRPTYYIVYRFYGKNIGDMEDPANILHITPFHQNKKKTVFYDKNPEINVNYTYIITSVNREHLEGKPSEAKVITIGKPRA
ncbi:MAG: hypothetical protein IPJ74_14945 [Saprospiraceae bacterium]|nr:hypothetical protein [Saprospiraceae bacterium]